MDIDAVVAGQELDALIAERVMGWEVVKYHGDATKAPYVLDRGHILCVIDRTGTGSEAYFRPSTDIAAAWLIVEHFDQKVSVAGPGAPVAYGEYNNDELWQAEIEGGRAYGLAKAETAPLAICRAALKMKGVS